MLTVRVWTTHVTVKVVCSFGADIGAWEWLKPVVVAALDAAPMDLHDVWATSMRFVLNGLAGIAGDMINILLPTITQHPPAGSNFQFRLALRMLTPAQAVDDRRCMHHRAGHPLCQSLLTEHSEGHPVCLTTLMCMTAPIPA